MPHKGAQFAVPATSANLGPGFDAVGAALRLYLRAEVRSARQFSLRFHGPNAPTHDGFARRIRDAIARVAGDLPAMRVDAVNEIPLGKGLGSSAAASVLGLLIGAHASGRSLSRAELAAHASALEGHNDNALPAVYGGIVISAGDAHVRLRAPKEISAVVVVPHIELSTDEARALLPEHYERADVAFTAARASLLGAALSTGSWHVLREAMRDRMHQPYRSPRIPGLSDALGVHARGLLGVALSGAGPSVLGLVRGGGGAAAAEAITGCFQRAGVEARPLQLAFAARGAMVRRG